MVPPWAIGERPEVELVRPRGSVLLREVDIGFRDVRGKHEAVMFLAPGRSQRLEPLWSQHLPQGVGRIHGAVAAALANSRGSPSMRRSAAVPPWPTTPVWIPNRAFIRPDREGRHGASLA